MAKFSKSVRWKTLGPIGMVKNGRGALGGPLGTLGGRLDPKNIEFFNEESWNISILLVKKAAFCQANGAEFI